MRVLAVIDELEIGGAQRHLLWLASALRRSGYEFLVVTSGEGPLGADFDRAGIPVVSLTGRSIKHRLSPRFTWRLTRLSRVSDFDFIHAHLHASSVAAAVASHLSGLPLVVTHHSMGTWQRPAHRAASCWADQKAAAAIAVSSNVARAIEGPGVRPAVIPNGVDPPSRTANPDRIASVRHDLGIPAGAYVVGWIGRHMVDKDPLLFPESAAKVAAHVSEAHFVMVGDGPLLRRVEERARALGIERRLTMTGFRRDVADLHAAFDVLVLTSSSEAAPLVVLEAMAQGRPVVATAVGDVPLQIQHGKTGFVVDRGNKDKLAEAVVHLADSSLRYRFGEFGRRRVLQHFTVDHMAMRTAAMYHKIPTRNSRTHDPRRRGLQPARRDDIAGNGLKPSSTGRNHRSDFGGRHTHQPGRRRG